MNTCNTSLNAPQARAANSGLLCTRIPAIMKYGARCLVNAVILWRHVNVRRPLEKNSSFLTSDNRSSGFAQLAKSDRSFCGSDAKNSSQAARNMPLLFDAWLSDLSVSSGFMESIANADNADRVFRILIAKDGEQNEKLHLCMRWGTIHILHSGLPKFGPPPIAWCLAGA
jgi:hypothetical protein